MATSKLVTYGFGKFVKNLEDLWKGRKIGRSIYMTLVTLLSGAFGGLTPYIFGKRVGRYIETLGIDFFGTDFSELSPVFLPLAVGITCVLMGATAGAAVSKRSFQLMMYLKFNFANIENARLTKKQLKKILGAAPDMTEKKAYAMHNWLVSLLLLKKNNAFLIRSHNVKEILEAFRNGNLMTVSVFKDSLDREIHDYEALLNTLAPNPTQDRALQSSTTVVSTLIKRNFSSRELTTLSTPKVAELKSEDITEFDNIKNPNVISILQTERERCLLPTGRFLSQFSFLRFVKSSLDNSKLLLKMKTELSSLKYAAEEAYETVKLSMV